MRLPNGYGSIVKLSGKRRKPFAVKITTGWADDGRQIQKYLSFHETRQAALSALAEYHEHPYDIDEKATTFDILYEKWTKLTYEDKDLPVPHAYTAAYKRLGNLHNMLFTEIRRRHIQSELDRCEMGYSTQKMMKTLCNKLFGLAIDMELVTVNFAADVELPPREESRLHKPFEPEEIAELWNHTDKLGAQIALVLIYTGMRPKELCKITVDNVHLEERYLMGGIKTAAGRNRVIPIAEKIFPIVSGWYDPDQPFLLMDPEHEGTPIKSYDHIRKYWFRVDPLRGHLPYDCRHTCATMLDDARTPLKTMQLILGHRSASVTHRVYTHKTIAQLVEAINKI